MSEDQSTNAEIVLESTKHQRQIAIIALLAVTLVWGATFIWMKQALDALGEEKSELGVNGVVASLVFARFAIAALMMLIFFKKARTSLNDKQIWQDGLVLGILMFIAYLSQMIGLDDIDPSVSAFLTSLYVVFTAIIASAYNLRLPTKVMILGVGLATFGAGFIQGPPHLTWGVAEFITVFCALLFALHILFTQYITTRRDPVAVSTTSFIVVTICSALTVFTLGDGTNQSQWALIFSDGVLIPVLLLGIGGSFFCLLFLNMYQRYLHPIQAAIIYALEPVWATIYGLQLDMVDWSVWILIGGGALFIGNIIVELLSNEGNADRTATERRIVQSPPSAGISERGKLTKQNQPKFTRFASKAVHSGTNHVGDAVNTPIFQSSTYKLTDERYAGWAAGAHHALLYTRITSVNAEAVIDKICALEGAEDGEVFSSGMAAISSTLMAVLSTGDHVVASADVYGGTYGLMTEEFPRFGIEVTMADMTDVNSYEAAIQPNTKVLYIETLTNPVLKVCDVEAMSSLAKKHGLICIIDNTFASPWACNPLAMGADLVIHSTTKYLGGHSDIIGGAVVGSKEHIENIFHRKVHFGGNADPNSCFLLERGMRTLHVRMPQICANAAELANRLEAHPMIERVNHPSLQSYPQYDIAQRIIPRGTGMIGFVVKGGDDAALSFMRGLEMIYEATSLGGVESLVECPFNSSHMMIPEDVRHAAGLVPGYVRMSIGIEDIEDLWADIERGFANI